MPNQRIVVSKSLSPGCVPSESRNLKLMMICCEEAAPYGPAEATAKIFLELLCLCHGRMVDIRGCDETNNSQLAVGAMSITVYHAQHNDYPASKEEWDSFDGIIIPGSFSSAFDTHISWIKCLHDVIRDEIHANQRKTLAVCFGHQSFAHALGEIARGTSRQGETCVCPTGKKAGRKAFLVTPIGKTIFGSRSAYLEMFYTHGDMVNTLPTTGLCLGGNDDVPIQSAAYFSSEEAALKYKENERTNDSIKFPYALTFQAHPEFISPDGFNVHFTNIVQMMKTCEYIDADTAYTACDDAKQNFDNVKIDSLDAIISAAQVLGWFPRGDKSAN